MNKDCSRAWHDQIAKSITEIKQRKKMYIEYLPDAQKYESPSFSKHISYLSLNDGYKWYVTRHKWLHIKG